MHEYKNDEYFAGKKMERLRELQTKQGMDKGYEKGGVITSRRFTGGDFNRLTDNGFEAIWDGDYRRIEHEKTGVVVGRFYPKREVLSFVGDKTLKNPLVKWCQENSFVSNEEYYKLEKGGPINPKLKELMDKLADYESKYEAAKKNNLQAGMDFAQKKMDVLKAEIKEAEGETVKEPEKEPKTVKKTAKAKKGKGKKGKKGTKKETYKYRLGDKYRSDFDYDGMLKMGAKAELSWGNIKLSKLHDSFEDVNYHKESNPLWDVVLFSKGSLKVSEKEAKEKIKEFNELCKNKLKKTHKTEVKAESKKEAPKAPEHKKVGPNRELHKLTETSYIIKNTKTDKADFDIEKRADGKWHTTCLTKEKLSFNTLDEAVEHIRKTLSKGEFRKIIDQKKKVSKKSREWREKHPTGKSSPTADVKTAVKKVEKKLEEAVDEGKNVDKQVESLVNQIIALIETIKKIVGKETAKPFSEIKKVL